MKQCEKCGQTIDDSAAFCTNCGASVNYGTTSSTSFGPNQSTDSGLPMPSSTTNQLASPTAPSVISPGTSTKTIDGKTIALIAVSALCLIIGIVGIVIGITNNGNKNSASDNQVAMNDSGAGTLDAMSSGNRISYAGYEFTIPNGYEYEIVEEDGDEALMTMPISAEYAAATYYDDSTTFAQIESNMEAIASELEAENKTSVSASVENVGGVKFLCFDLGTAVNTNVMYAISKVDLYSFQTAIATDPGVSGKQYLGDVAKIIGSAQKKKSINKTLNDNGPEELKLQKLTFNLDK